MTPTGLVGRWTEASARRGGSTRAAEAVLSVLLTYPQFGSCL